MFLFYRVGVSAATSLPSIWLGGLAVSWKRGAFRGNWDAGPGTPRLETEANKMTTPSVRERRIKSLQQELAQAQEHAEGDYVGEAFRVLRALANDEERWSREAWVEMGSLAGSIRIEAEFLLLNRQPRGWPILERSVVYWAWVIKAFPEKFFVGNAAAALIKATWLNRLDWADGLAELVCDSLRERQDLAGGLLWVDFHLDIAAFSLWLHGLARVSRRADVSQWNVEGTWGKTVSLVGRGEFRAAFVEAADEHLRLSTDDVAFCTFVRGDRLMAPEIRLLAAICQKWSEPVDPSWHPLLSLPFSPIQKGGFSETDDPIMRLIAERAH